MRKVKVILDVVSNLRSLADSVQAVADAMLQNEPTIDAEPKTPAPAPKKETPKYTETEYDAEDILDSIKKEIISERER